MKTRNGRLWVRAVVPTLVAAALLLPDGAPAFASTGVGSFPWQYNCGGHCVGPSTYAVRVGNGPVLGWLKIYYSSACGSAYGHFASADPNKWTLNASVWHPGQPLR